MNTTEIWKSWTKEQRLGFVEEYRRMIKLCKIFDDAQLFDFITTSVEYFMPVFNDPAIRNENGDFNERYVWLTEKASDESLSDEDFLNIAEGRYIIW